MTQLNNKQALSSRTCWNGRFLGMDSVMETQGEGVEDDFTLISRKGGRPQLEEGEDAGHMGTGEPRGLSSRTSLGTLS